EQAAGGLLADAGHRLGTGRPSNNTRLPPVSRRCSLPLSPLAPFDPARSRRGANGRVAVIASGGNAGAANPGIERGVTPFDCAFLSHGCPPAGRADACSKASTEARVPQCRAPHKASASRYHDT